MAFVSYITYTEYVDLGGTVSENEFPILERKAQRYLDAITFNRIPHLTVIPDTVKEVLVDFIDKLRDYNNQSSDGETLSEYSNGVEKLTFRRVTETELTRSFYKTAKAWLPEYLVNRSVNFDVEKYLQSNGNNS